METVCFNGAADTNHIYKRKYDLFSSEGSLRIRIRSVRYIFSCRNAVRTRCAAETSRFHFTPPGTVDPGRSRNLGCWLA